MNILNNIFDNQIIIYGTIILSIIIILIAYFKIKDKLLKNILIIIAILDSTFIISENIILSLIITIIGTIILNIKIK